MAIFFNESKINDWNYGSDNIVKVYRNNAVCYYKITGGGDVPPTPTGSTCSEVIPYSISAYSSTTYDSVYSYTDGKWYKLNNLNQYEEYGIYGDSIATSATYYEGKLAIVDGTRYVFSGDSQSGYEWVENPSRLPI